MRLIFGFQREQLGHRSVGDLGGAPSSLTTFLAQLTLWVSVPVMSILQQQLEKSSLKMPSETVQALWWGPVKRTW